MVANNYDDLEILVGLLCELLGGFGLLANGELLRELLGYLLGIIVAEYMKYLHQ
jgi:hypothetical protein